jgi:hypothetical protein
MASSKREYTAAFPARRRPALVTTATTALNFLTFRGQSFGVSPPLL